MALRFVIAALSVLIYLLVREELNPGALVAARFGLGLVLFTVLVDAGRAVAGAHPPVPTDMHPHSQRAEPLVDDRYRRVHEAMRAFVDEGTWTQRYERLVDQALEDRGVPSQERQQALERASRTAGGEPPSHRPMTLALVSGMVVVAGMAVAIGVLLEALDTPLLAPLLLLTGSGTYLLQLRGLRAGHRWAAVLPGVVGALLVFLGATALNTTGAGPLLLQLTAALLLVGAVIIQFIHDFQVPPWSEVRGTLEEELTTLRRAFLATLLAGLVLFPFKPLLDALFQALSWSLEVPYRVAVIGYATVAVFLALELAGAWYALSRGQTRARQLRQQRAQANEELLDLLEARQGTKASPGGTTP